MTGWLVRVERPRTIWKGFRKQEPATDIRADPGFLFRAIVVSAGFAVSITDIVAAMLVLHVITSHDLHARLWICPARVTP